MTFLRGLLVLSVLSAVSAAGLALASRTPREVRLAPVPPNATDPSLGAEFSDDQIARHGRYRSTTYLNFVLATIIQIATLLVLARGPLARFADRIDSFPGGWPVRAALLGAVVAAALTLVALPLSYVRGFAIEQAWGLSTQDTLAWLADRGRSFMVGAVIAAVSAVAFFAIVRWQPRSWWLWGWGVFTLLTAALVFLWPAVVAPLFNKFTPLPDGPLRERVLALADEAGVEVDEVEVADASKRSTVENAYVAGFGKTKKLVLYDTLLNAGGDDETAFVVAHELGHRVEGHVWKGVLLSSLGLLAGFGVLKLLAGNDSLWAWASASGIRDLKALPLLFLYSTVAALIVLPIDNTLSRNFEAKADQIALDLTNDPDTAVGVFRRLAFSNIADLRPPDPAVWVLFSHPPIPDRIEALMAGSESSP